ncbi:hypothetical protein F4805DRAFT_476790 [Annulohypoxylon moriforme]|nr:hypothetical protein F4805DRAFT_476790 [Annulohypoxylon moriforme]
MSPNTNKKRRVAEKLGIHPTDVLHLKKFDLGDTRPLFLAMARVSRNSPHTYVLLKSPSKDSSPEPSSPADDNRGRKILHEIDRRRKAERELKKARDILRSNLVNEGNERKAWGIESPSSASELRPIWENTEFERWLRRETNMSDPLLTPTFERAVSISSKSAEEWDPWSGSDKNHFPPRFRAFIHNTKWYYVRMRELSIPREIVAPGEYSEEEQETTGQIKYVTEEELKKFNRLAVREIKRFFNSKGMATEGRKLKNQHTVMSPRDFSTRINVVASDCCKEMWAFNKCIHDSTMNKKNRLKKRSYAIKDWNSTRARQGRGNFKGASAGRPSPLRSSINASDIEEQYPDTEDETEPITKESDWGVEDTNVDLSSVEW